ncbi:aminoglycoside adenylyltransferase family protein [Streptomyces xiangluensis]|uniref:Aminoglycoside adenylyltransferase family protein n=1 Tax=Streptomyces xiangluensis TaxID=2665720 RepID=A0ABV8YZM3_9ACTN
MFDRTPQSGSPSDSQTDDVLRLVHRVLGSDVVGVYLHGSAVLGGLRPGSDLDLFVVARRRTTERERRALVQGLIEVSECQARSGSGRRPVELTVVAQDDVRPWRCPPRCEFLYGEWLRDEFERGVVPAPAPQPDLAPLITMVLLGNAPLFGPPPADVLDPVPPEDLRRAIVAGVPELLAELESDPRNVLLTLARIWTTLETGTITSKDEAAGWALDRLPDRYRSVLARARSVYLGDERESWDGLMSQVRALADHLVAELNAQERQL